MDFATTAKQCLKLWNVFLFLSLSENSTLNPETKGEKWMFCDGIIFAKKDATLCFRIYFENAFIDKFDSLKNSGAENFFKLTI